MAVFYHCWSGGSAMAGIMAEQMISLRQCGLADAALEIHVGHNGLTLGADLARWLMLPEAFLHDWGPSPLGETPTLNLIHLWVKFRPGWNVCYFHSKGASHGDRTFRWRRCMERVVLWRWPECQKLLESVDSVGAHWMCNAQGQWFWGGNFWWATSEYLRKLPAPLERSRWDAEIWVSNVTRAPTTHDLADHVLGQCV